MKMRQLLFNQKNKKYYLLDDKQDIVCDICGKYSEEFIHFRLSKGQRIHDSVFCSSDCASKNQNFLARVGEVKVVVPTTEFIEGSVLVVNKPVELGDGDISCVDAAVSNKGIKADASQVKVVDKAVLSKGKVCEVEGGVVDVPVGIDWANVKRKKRG